MTNTLILWDIDGTLLRSGGAGMRALARALADVFGVEGSADGIDFAGRTDPWIIRCIFSKFAIPDSPVNRGRLLDAYLERLPAELAATAQVLPGVRPLLQAIADRPGFSQALLTGNIRRGAQTKLGHHGLWDYFPCGAFADDSETRNELGPVALRRASAHFQTEFHPDRIWVVGDTPHDIACARAAGMRALAVATGSSPAPELAAHGPDAVLKDLADPDAFWTAVGRTAPRPPVLG